VILVDLPSGTTLFRALTPLWASRPTSGAGAAFQGGRFNREGVEALYLSLEELTALREYQQTSPFLPPCTMCSYTVALRDLVDLRQLHRGEPWDELWHDWREIGGTSGHRPDGWPQQCDTARSCVRVPSRR
jgi:RES domain-containing protein